MHQALCVFNDCLFLQQSQYVSIHIDNSSKMNIAVQKNSEFTGIMMGTWLSEWFTHFLDKGHAKHWKNPVTSLKFSVSASHDVNVPKLSRDLFMEKRSYWPRLWLNGQRCSLIIYCIDIVFNTCMFYFAHDYILLFIMCQFLLSFLLFL